MGPGEAREAARRIHREEQERTSQSGQSIYFILLRVFADKERLCSLFLSLFVQQIIHGEVVTMDCPTDDLKVVEEISEVLRRSNPIYKIPLMVGLLSGTATLQVSPFFPLLSVSLALALALALGTCVSMYMCIPSYLPCNTLPV